MPAITISNLTHSYRSHLALRDGQLFKGKWKRDKVNEWFTFTLPDGKLFELRPGNTYIHFYNLESPFSPIDIETR